MEIYAQYTVRAGETLSRVAVDHNLTLTELLAINRHIENPDLIATGAIINVPAPDTDHTVPPWYRVALAELKAGVKELPGASRNNPRILDYHRITTLRATTDEVSWCASFVSFCLETAGVPSTKSAAARSYDKYGQNVKGKLRLGDILVKRRGNSAWQGHVGFFAGMGSPSTVKLLGGNQGDRISIADFPLSVFHSFRRPEGF